MTNEEFDRAVRAEGYPLLCGVDEAGRGPLAGPVFAAAVILDPDTPIAGLNDSKKLSEKKREALFDLITERAAAYAVDWSDRSGPAVRFKCAGTTGDTRFPFRRSTHIPYYLRVRALDAAGRQLAESQILKTPVARVLRPQLEALSRGLVAVKANTGVFVSWRLFRSEVAGFDDTGLTGADFVLFIRNVLSYLPGNI